jgi:putative inorganic carbon (HCO3(-)) transporter
VSAVAGARPGSSELFRESSALIVLCGAATVLLAAVAVYSPKYALGAIAATAFLALALKRLVLGVAVFTVLTFPENLPGTLGAGATVAKPLGAVLAVAWIVNVVARQRSARLLSRDMPGAFWAACALLVLAGTSALWAPSLGQVGYEMPRLLQVVLLFLVVYTAVSTSSDFYIVVWAFLIGSVVTGAYSIATGSFGAAGRLGGIFDPNYFTAELIPAILISLFLMLTKRGRTRALAVVVLAFDLIAFALAQSRGGIIGLFVALIAAVALAGRARPRVIAGVLIFAAVAVGYYFEFAPYHLRSTFSQSLGGASSGRADEWRIAARMLGNHPFGGVGLGNFVVLEPSYSTQTFNLNFVNQVVTRPLVAHNSYLEVAAELGLGGVALLLGILGLVWYRAGRALAVFASARDPIEFYARGLVAGAIGMFTAYVFLSGQYEKQLWLVLGLLAALSALARQTLTQPEAHVSDDRGRVGRRLVVVPDIGQDSLPGAT